MWKKSLFLLFFCLPVWAFEVTQDFKHGFYWQSLPISITVIESDENRKKLLQQLSRDAIGEWEARTGLKLWSFNEAASTNAIRWSSSFASETRMDPMSVLAVAIRHTNGPYFAKTEIVINGSHPLNKDLSHLLTTITHELGHTMGLDHSGNGFAVMAPTLQDPYRGLHADDIEGMNYVYAETENRQLTRYVSPLAYEKTESKQPLSCATVTMAAGQSQSGLFSMAFGLLIGFVRKIFRWFKSLF